jgi:hypothetical protein
MKTRILLIGLGPHARRFYVPALLSNRFASSFEIAAVVELHDLQPTTSAFLLQNLPAAGLICVDPFYSADCPHAVQHELNQTVQCLGIGAVIIATDPLTHIPYARWAVAAGLPLLMDKPVSSRKNALYCVKAASGIEEDFNQLAALYLSMPKTKRAPFLLCVHRRYHPGINHAIEIIRQTSAQTGCPVTHVHGYHCDGQWRMPAEILTQSHHSYFDGHGKMSHSGYHFFDCFYRFQQAGYSSGKSIDSAGICTSAVTPRGFIKQLHRQDYLRLFGASYHQTCPTDDESLRNAFQSFGEVDAEVQISLAMDGDNVSIGSICLCHNGFSRRSSLKAGTDLYKGNGRVKHEYHRIHVGPFLNLQIHSYQSKDKHDLCSVDDVLPGGNNHFEIWIFRNNRFVNGEPFEKVSLNEIASANNLNQDRLFIEQIKEGALHEFLDVLTGRITEAECRSSILSHQMPVRLMSAAYISAARRHSNSDPYVSIRWENSFVR